MHGVHTHLEEVSFPKRMFSGMGRKFHQLPSLSSSSATYHAPQRQLSVGRGQRFMEPQCAYGEEEARREGGGCMPG